MADLSRRTALDTITFSPTEVQHAGLWLDRLLPKQPAQDEKLATETLHPHAQHIQEAARIREAASYQRFYERSAAALASIAQPTGYALRSGIAAARGRIAVGLGSESVLENAITLHRIYGVPYIPGSALKGVAAAFAHQRLEDATWRRPDLVITREAPVSAHEILFGSTRSAGYVTFYDALYEPGSGQQGRMLAPDVLTVHHQDYYKGSATPPADWDSPTPIHFITATGSFRVTLAGPAAWLATAWQLLALALDELGVGGKTAAGYGRMDLEGLDEARGQCRAPHGEVQHVANQAPATPAAQAQNPPVAVVPATFTMQVQKSNAGSLPNLMSQLRQLAPEVQVAAAQQMIAHARAIKVKNLEEKAWFQELQRMVAV
ncbi:MAG: type III-B CRISPR module RAMP protein Cmr6 [Candidatus Viridilinea halotolerans]|uniref:Type III-B CRISPR module RAMP protein Cmr6 n=1 Tax=Candidatus Viridilinea halotolerans TaxID=2491704 RepID=A0A426TY80_9CHLR|nr:MAG: type III-B CRISPR module RAMP protein Cmr6 [Candidatus Viridilinea halotolerans]